MYKSGEDLEIEMTSVTDEQIKAMEISYKQRRVQRKNSTEKRCSVKLKNINKELAYFNKQEAGMLQTLGNYFENVQKNLELIDDFFMRKSITFVSELKNKINAEEYKFFLSSLEITKLLEGDKLQELGKFHNHHYIVIQGSVAAYRQKKTIDQEIEDFQAFQFEIGEALISNTLQNHKFNPYTNKAKTQSLLLRFSQDVYNRSIRKIHSRQIDQLCSQLCHTLLFKSVPVEQMKKYLPYFSFKRYRYNQLVYQEGELIKQLFFILEGEIQISYQKQERHQRQQKSLLVPLIPPNLYKMNHQAFDKKSIKIVKVGKKELFGLEAGNIYKDNYYEHHVRVSSDILKTISIGLDVLNEIEAQHPNLQENITYYLKKVMNMHSTLLEKYHNMSATAPVQKKKKKRKMKKKQEISLEWWGLAAKINDTKKYRLPTPPKSQSQKSFTRKQPLIFQNRTTKIQNFRRRLFQDEIEGLEQIEQKQNNSPIPPQGLIPKLQKVKIKMINARPKVINNAERVKRKLVEYAKNGEVFCDKLQLH